MNKGRLPYRIKELHDEFGPIVRLAADELSFNDAQAWKDIYNRRDMLRPPQWGSRPPGVEAHSLISAPTVDHARFRKALNLAFSEKSTREYGPVVRSFVLKLIAKLGMRAMKGPVDLVEWINITTFDIIGEITWSQSYGCLESGTGHAFMGVLLHFQAFLIAASIGYYPWLNRFIIAITPKSAFRLLEDIFNDSHERLKNRSRYKPKRSAHPDVFGHLESYQANAAGDEKLSEAEMEQNLLTVIVGGSETLTTAISGAFHYLLMDPSILTNLVQEVRSGFSKEKDIDAQSLSKLPYLNAVIDETLRLCPPFPDALRRQVPSTGAVVAGQAIPPGTTVSVSCYSMFRSPSFFSEANSFVPERWIDAWGGSEAEKAFHPFAIGPHNCLGQPLARMELRLILALLLWNFDVKIAQDERLRKWDEQKIYWTWDKQPLRVELRETELNIPVRKPD